MEISEALTLKKRAALLVASDHNVLGIGLERLEDGEIGVVAYLLTADPDVRIVVDGLSIKTVVVGRRQPLS